MKQVLPRFYKPVRPTLVFELLVKRSSRGFLNLSYSFKLAYWGGNLLPLGTTYLFSICGLNTYGTGSSTSNVIFISNTISSLLAILHSSISYYGNSIRDYIGRGYLLLLVFASFSIYFASSIVSSPSNFQRRVKFINSSVVHLFSDSSANFLQINACNS